MKRRICKIGTGEVISVGIIILLVFRFVSVYLNQEEKLHSELFMLFTEVVQEEKEQQIGKQKRHYDPQNSPNDIPGEEKHTWCVQDYLTKYDSSRYLLDSLFRDILQKEHIEVETAIRCIRNGKVINSSTDSLFYKKASSLKPIVYRIDENKERNITLQAYVDVPVQTVLGQIGWFWVLSYSFFIILICYCGFYFENIKKKIEKIIRLLRTSRQTSYELIEQQKIKLTELQTQKQKTELISKQQAELIEQKQAELFALQNEIIPLKPEQKKVWIALPYGFFFAEKEGILRNDKGVDICLKNNPLRLFLAFVNAEDYKLSYEDICVNVLARPIKNGADQSDRENVSTAIYRLKKCLKPFPCIQIKVLRDFGYQIVFSNYQNDTTQPGKSD
ncbi:hypothetical protein F090043F1_06410 [Parabacteroides goldsteinii]|uniref:hypothetical protein n=1 Tax=Parabacteroides goldsteinii TaxID=328812 RepID=UPI00189FAD93|nr:hypothetical protein [Parabacteroides goldsteinii]